MWTEYLQYLAVAINNLCMSFDCDVIAGGYVGAFLEEFGCLLYTSIHRSQDCLNLQIALVAQTEFSGEIHLVHRKHLLN